MSWTSYSRCQVGTQKCPTVCPRIEKNIYCRQRHQVMRSIITASTLINILIAWWHPVLLLHRFWSSRKTPASSKRYYWIRKLSAELNIRIGRPTIQRADEHTETKRAAVMTSQISIGSWVISVYTKLYSGVLTEYCWHRCATENLDQATGVHDLEAATMSRTDHCTVQELESPSSSRVYLSSHPFENMDSTIASRSRKTVQHIDRPIIPFANIQEMSGESLTSGSSQSRWGFSFAQNNIHLRFGNPSTFVCALCLLSTIVQT